MADVKEGVYHYHWRFDAMKPLEFTRNEWIPLQQRLVEDHGLGVINISWVCRRELGFTIRHHRLWQADAYDGYGEWENVVILDFYDPAKETWFRLKYL